MRTSSGEQSIEGSDVLVATGRSPNTAGIGLDAAGVELDGRGYIKVNERLETTAPAVWAIGECAGSPQFTHVWESPMYRKRCTIEPCSAFDSDPFSRKARLTEVTP
ncbi:MAG: FAD-dependent oxidoreductase [Methylocella sp.]